MRIDCHTHATGLALHNLFHGRYPTGQSVRDLVLKMDRSRVDLAVCFPICSPLYFDDDALRRGTLEPGGVEQFPFELLNRQHLLEVVTFGSGRVLPFAGIAPAHEVAQQAAELDRLSFGWFGLKHHTRATGSPANDLIGSPFVAFAHRQNIPILVHTNPNPDWTHARHVLAAAQAHPEVRFCIAHAADFDAEILRAVSSVANVYVDVSPLQSLCVDIGRLEDPSPLLPGLDLSDPPAVLADLHAALPHRLLWGTDEPWTAISGPAGEPLTAYDYADEVSVLEQVGAEVRQAICFENPVRWLFGEDLDEAQVRERVGTRLAEAAQRRAELLPLGR